LADPAFFWFSRVSIGIAGIVLITCQQVQGQLKWRQFGTGLNRRASIMSNPWEADDCAHLRAHYAVYSVPQAAALWCGVPEAEVARVASEAQQLSHTGFGRGVWVHPSVPCMEPRSRAIAEAIESDLLPHGREDGESVAKGEHVAYERRHVMGRHLREWMINAFPNEKLAFLFDDIERSSHTAISPDAYRALEAETKKLEFRLDNAKVEYQKLRLERDELKKLLSEFEAKHGGAAVPGARAEATYQNIIAALLEVIAGNLPAVERHPSFPSEAKLIEAIDKHYSGYPGLSKSNLTRKFPEAKRALEMQ